MAVLVMAFGNVGFAQSKANLKEMSKQYVFKQMGLSRESYLMPQEANYFEVDGTQHRTNYYYDELEFTLSEEIVQTYYDYWVNESRVSYEYDFYGNVMEMLLQVWDGTDWEDQMLVSFDYDGDVLNEVVYQSYMNGVWWNVEKEVYNYNGDTWTVLYWLWNGTTWASDMLYTYTRSGNTIELVMQYMEGGAWQNNGKEIYTLDFDENVTEILYQEWDNGTWVNFEKTTYIFENGVYTEQFFQYWYDSSWYDSYYFTFEYDEAGNAKHGSCFEDDETLVPANGDIEMSYDYNANTLTYYGHQVDVSYVDLTAVNENKQACFKVYPVPAENEILIQADDFQKAEIYSLTGQKVMESEVDKINVETLVSGVYLLKVYNNEGEKQMQKIVVK